MKKFRIYEHPQKGLEAVKLGFSWPAFFFGILWMVFKSLWKYAGIWFVLYILMALMESHLKSGDIETGLTATYDIMLMIFYLIVMLIPAFIGNSWVEKKLQNQGYVLLKEVTASNPKQALADLSAQQDQD